MRWLVERPDLPQPRRQPVPRRTRCSPSSAPSRSTARSFDLVRARTPGRPPRHAARRHRVGPGRLRQGGATTRHSDPALPVLSWDNLTNKGLIRVQPDQVFVWNEAQKAEAVVDARDESGPRRRHGCDGLRPVVRPARQHHARGVLRARRPRSGAGRSSSISARRRSSPPTK